MAVGQCSTRMHPQKAATTIFGVDIQTHDYQLCRGNSALRRCVQSYLPFIYLSREHRLHVHHCSAPSRSFVMIHKTSLRQ